MKQFVQLFSDLDASTSTLRKVQAMVQYFRKAEPADAAWAVYFLAGGKPRRTVPTRTLRQAALLASGLPEWLFEESYQAVGDLAETIAHVVPIASQAEPLQLSLAQWMHHIILPLRDTPEDERLPKVLDVWQRSSAAERFLFVKLVGGGFRVGVSKLLLTRALSEWCGVDAKLLAQRLMGYTDATQMPTAQAFEALLQPDSAQARPAGQPLPFFLAHPLQAEPDTLGPVSDWLVEWKYDGIRAQIIREAGQVWIWSRGEELVSHQFPELVNAFADWPEGSILDGEILVWRGGQPAGFKDLQTRLNRKVVSTRLQAEHPVVFLAYDLLMHRASVSTPQPQRQRRAALEAFVQQHPSPHLLLSESVQADSWQALATLREESRARGVEGFMLKHLESAYGVGRTKADGVWWKWKIDPMTVDCVLVYAQRGHGRRASLYTDYTFAVWEFTPANGEQAQAVAQAIANGDTVEHSQARGLPRLVPFAKAYSGLTDEEFKRVDTVIRKTTVNKFGPVRTVVPSLVFELGFEAIAPSSRHKSGVAVRFTRMLRIRDDKPLHEADTLGSLAALMTDTPIQE
ncbi:cisplatin damage response ATP-dependent DNA ligase [Limnobacter sp.]|uniref:cisplatin damage response ATP-dependent DNA ligase n=1 Tax=Limnobacter sp. TaxID=2003368 RepID=UPI002585324B|nr:cisplatin damage response ATP-dependent DNA ligase [Limnobacter sp.]